MTLPKRVFHRVESSLRRHWPTLTHVLRTVSVEFCVPQWIVVVCEVLAACFAGFFASFSVISSWGIIFDLLSKTLELHENVQ